MHRILFVLFFCPFIGHAQIPKPKPNTYIDDYTNHLSVEQLQDLNEQFRQLESSTGVQMAAVLVNDLPENVALEDYARNIGNTWKVGRSHNGLVYVAVLHIRRQRLEVAKNLEGTITDVIASHIIESLKDNLQAKNYYGALSILVTQVSNQLGSEINFIPNDSLNTGEAFKATPSAPALESDFDREDAKHSFYADIALLIILIGAGGLCFWGPGSDDGGGSGGFGDFGGGGGGGFSGGGASGSW